jgi:chromosome segregation ATPase
MSELVIKYHDFENAKKEIKKFSEQTTTDLDLKRVDDSKEVGEWFGDFFLGGGIGLKHKVTGEELNELTTQIQSHLHSINNTQIKLIKEFGQVYSALEALDKDYIQAILVSIKATEETSQSIQETQGKIKKIVENQRKTLEELKKFKRKLDSYVHLGEIDEIWNDCQKWYKEINKLTNSISSASASSKESAQKADVVKSALKAAEKTIDDLSKLLAQQTVRLESIISFTGALEKITHLQDIDEMWESISSAHDSLQNIGDELNCSRIPQPNSKRI